MQRWVEVVLSEGNLNRLTCNGNENRKKVVVGAVCHEFVHRGGVCAGTDAGAGGW